MSYMVLWKSAKHVHGAKRSDLEDIAEREAC